MDVPLICTYEFGTRPPLVIVEVFTFTPGATTCGKILPLPHPTTEGEGPRLLKNGTVFVLSVAPTAKEPELLAGLKLVPEPEPLFPAAKTTEIPAAFRACISG